MVIIMMGFDSGCAKLPNYIPPRATIMLSPPPVEIKAEALYGEWMSDSEGTLNKYKSIGLFFRKVIVEQIVMPAGSSEPFIRTGRLKLVVGAPGDLAKIRVGDTVDVVGMLQGLEDDNLLFSDCWVRFVDTRKPQGY
jgi:hypothetical protein